MDNPLLSGYLRADGRLGARNHLLILPSVVCATRVARDIAEASSAVSIVHQLGCGQVGDDAVCTGKTFEALATHPNVGAVLVVSLGCETLQGRDLVARIKARGQLASFIAIQESGGATAAVEEGVALARGLREELDSLHRVGAGAADLAVGVEAAEPTPLLLSFVRSVREAGAAVVVGDSTLEQLSGLREVPSRRPAFTPARLARGLTVLEAAGRGAQEHVALAVAGAQVIVSFPGRDTAPVGLAVCPVVTVVGGSPLHRALADDFDLDGEVDASEAWDRVLDVQRGAPAAVERQQSVAFAFKRVAMTM